ncbi:MAG: peptidylprolyl isomerase [Ginsengibacter sp.]
MKKGLFLLCFFAFTTTLFAQTQKVVADKIIATIGDKIVLKSEIDNSITDMQRQKIELPDNAHCLLLEQSLAMKALVLYAERDSIPVSDEEVESRIDNKMRGFIQMYGSKAVLEQVAGRTVFQIKEDFRIPFHEQLAAENARNKIVSNIRITPKEVQEFYDKIPKDSLHFYESELEIGQIVIYPKPSRDLETYAIDQLKDYKKEVEAGTKKFEVLASAFTDDPGSKETGGMYEINRNEKQMDPLFISKAFSLKDGQISNVFKTKFGYHIIQMVSRRGDDATVRHILKIPQVSSIEIKQAMDKMDSVRNLVADGSIQFGEAVNKYSEDDDSKFTAGRLTRNDGTGSTSLTIDQLDKGLVLMLDTLKVGSYSTATEFTDARGKSGIRIVHLISKSDPHRENLKDDFDKVSQRALEEKKGNALDDWFATKMPTFYVNIAPEYQQCPEMKKWLDNGMAKNK